MSTTTYPPARRDDTVDQFHGTPVPDPYRWMEAPDSGELRTWLEAQAALTESHLHEQTGRAETIERLKALWHFTRYTVPVRRGTRYFFTRNDGLQNQAVLYVQEGLNGEARVLIDPNTLSEDGTVAMVNYVLSEDGRLVAYACASGGSDLQEIRVREVDSGRDLPEVLRWCRFSAIAWKHDSSGFYYNRYPQPGTVPDSDLYYNNKVYFHRVGSDQAADALVYERPDAPDFGFGPAVSEDGAYLWLVVWNAASNKNRLYYRAESGGDFVRLLDDAGICQQPIGSVGSTVYLLTDRDAERSQIVALDLNNPAERRIIVPENADALEAAALVGGHIAALYAHDGAHRIALYTLEGGYVRDLPLPAIGSIMGWSGRQDDAEMFVRFESFMYPPTILRHDFASGQTSTFREAGLTFDPAQYETRQIFATSKDRTRVPVFVTHRKGLALDGSHPTILTGYGGYGVNNTPSFGVGAFEWVEQGGVWALAILRGGAEYGEKWHEQGMLGNKQNVFDDFIAAAETLIHDGYTQPRQLAIFGGSNGGLLVAACMLQRPDLYGAVLCAVPVTDMLRFKLYTAGRFWVDEYGDADLPDHFRFLYAYSPLHNVPEGIKHPPILITTADGDDRVVPMHSQKFTAELQHKGGGQNVVLLRYEFKAGHGFGKPTSKQIEEIADLFTFARQAMQTS